MPSISTESGTIPMTWLLIVTGLGAAVLLALGFNLIVPLSNGIGGLCDLAGIASAVVFLGLTDGG
jgi:hypothetical protein